LFLYLLSWTPSTLFSSFFLFPPTLRYPSLASILIIMPPARLAAALVQSDTHTQRELEHSNKFAVWLAGGWNLPHTATLNDVHRNLMDTMSIYSLKGEAAGLYYEWDFSAGLPNNPKAHSFFSSLSVDDSVRFYIQSHPQLRKHLRPIYAEATGGKPFGKYIATLGKESRRLQGLFVQMFGHRNFVPCSHCENRYLHTFVRLHDSPPKSGFPVPLRGKSKSDRVHVMVPWFECVSLPGFHNGVCGNCLYHVEGSSCSYHPDHSFSSAIAPFRASSRISADLGDRKLSPSNCERASDDLLGDVDESALSAWQKDERDREAAKGKRKGKTDDQQPPASSIVAADGNAPAPSDKGPAGTAAGPSKPSNAVKGKKKG